MDTFPLLDRFSTEKEDLYVCLLFARIFDNVRTDRILLHRIVSNPSTPESVAPKVWLCCIYGALSAFSPENREEEVAEDLFDILLDLDTNEERLGGVLLHYCAELGVCLAWRMIVVYFLFGLCVSA